MERYIKLYDVDGDDIYIEKLRIESISVDSSGEYATVTMYSGTEYTINQGYFEKILGYIDSQSNKDFYESVEDE